MSLACEPLRLIAGDAPRALIIHVTDAREAQTLDDMLGHLARLAGGGWAYAALAVSDWDGDLSPWPVTGRRFGGNARRTLDALLTQALPRLTGVPDGLPICLGGYSLAGLFALWAAYACDRFDAVAAASPSVWYPGWDAFADARAPRVRGASLSLGKRESRARDPQMATVGEAIVRQQARFEAAGIPCAFAWNEGGHFTEPEKRTAAAFASAMNILTGEIDR
ncbi:MAG: esterase [Clostridia bacterium]|nr:esterase [Clostridia bacterium]